MRQTPVSEHALQNTIRNALAGLCILFRANVGRGWTSGERPVRATRAMTVAMFPGDVLLRKARPFDTGLPPGFSDTFGLVSVTITQDMVGSTMAQALFGEIKTEDGRVSPNQAAFLQAMKNHGARAGVWRSTEDALATVRGEERLK